MHETPAERGRTTYVSIPGETLPPGVTRKPMSDAVRTGDTLYVSGRIGLDPQTGRPPATIAGEVTALIDNLRGVLEHAGMTLRDVVSVTIYATDVNDFEAFNRSYLEHFDAEALPARAFIGAGTLLFDARFELTAIAVATDTRQPE